MEVVGVSAHHYIRSLWGGGVAQAMTVSAQMEDASIASQLGEWQECPHNWNPGLLPQLASDTPLPVPPFSWAQVKLEKV